MKLLYDGWPLVYGGDEPGAIHLLTLLEAHPLDIPAWVALPGEPFHPLPAAEITGALQACPDTDAGRLRWQQRILPRLARSLGASHIHSVSGALALFGNAAGVISPAGCAATKGAGRPSGLAARLGAAMGAGGAARARAWLWPADLPDDPALERAAAPLRRLPPAAHPAFHPTGGERSLQARLELGRLDLPEEYILYHGPAHERSLARLLDAWSWAAGPIGANCPLLLAGLDAPAQERLASRLAEYGLTGTARPLPPVSLAALADLYRRCRAVIHLGESSPWAGAARLALACARPLAAVESPALAALAGPAAYLVPRQAEPREDARRLGAALLTIIVEDGLADALAQSAATRAQSWDFAAFKTALRGLYRSL